ncbi:MAG TPA: exonuclease, partial [Candidatus Wildermuthbacteria bacterium]|nr:exonuclease [Candidatus Wildermuthbacteria bacterium]
MRNLIFVDCEATGGSPSTGTLTEFGAVDYETRKAFHGILVEAKPLATNRALSVVTGKSFSEAEVFRQFGEWLLKVCKGGRPIFVSDNPAYDWQWINDGFHKTLGKNPFGHSARRISDFYAGLCGDFSKTQEWKKLRKT